MSLNPDDLKKLSEFLEQLDQAGISTADMITSFKSSKSPTKVSANVRKLTIHTAADTSNKFHNSVLPRRGNIDPNGIFVGNGKANQLVAAKNYYCYRDLDLGHKTLSEINKITTACKEGLVNKPEYRFVLATEESKSKLNDTLREMETFMVDHGMEACFNIIGKQETFNAFREFGRVSDEEEQDWIESILHKGVRVSPGSDERYEVCMYDVDNMEYSGEAILNSCSPALKRTIMRELPVEDRNGISVFFSAIRHGRTFNNANVRTMCNDLEKMDLRKYPGENVIAFCHDALDKVDEIRLAAQQKTDLENLTQLSVHGLSLGSDEGLRSEVREVIKIANKPGSTMTPEAAAKIMTTYYIDVTTRKAYGPMKESTSSLPQAYQAYVQDQINRASDRLTQVRDASSSSGRGGRGGRGNGGRGGGAGRGNGAERARHMSVSSGDTGDAATNRKVNNMIKDWIAANPNGPPNNDDELHIKDGDDIVAKWCNICKRWTKGNKLHYTLACNRERPADAAQPEGNLAANDGTSLASGGTSNLTDSDSPSTDPAPQPAAGLMSLRSANYETPSSRSANFGWVPRYGGRGY